MTARPAAARRGRPWLYALPLALVVVVGVGVSIWPGRAALPTEAREAAAPRAAAPGTPVPAPVAAPPVAEAPGESPADRAVRHVDQLWVQGSLRGTALDGDWGRWHEGRLQPGLALRRRFDYLLTGLGEVDPAALRHWVEQAVQREKGPAAAAQVLAIWDRYLALRQRPLARQAGDATRLDALLAEQASIRRATLGAAWAEAFFGDEERAALRDLAGRDEVASSTPATEALPDDPLLAQPDEALGEAGRAELQARRVARFGPEAAERLKAQDASWQDWQRRLAQARERLQAIAIAAELSAPQRSEVREAYLHERFSAAEQPRVRALLSVGP